MAERPKFFDDIAGVAGGALSALAGLREEAESMVHAAIDDAIRRFDLVRRSELEAVQDLAANARAAQEAAEAATADAREQAAQAAHAAEARLTALESRVAALEMQQKAAPPPEDVG
jgi:BMFP domain-containing protein YqiC